MIDKSRSYYSLVKKGGRKMRTVVRYRWAISGRNARLGSVANGPK